MKPFCIYHGNCADGFGAAWVVRKYFGGEVDFHAGVYQNSPPDVKGRLVMLVDFSYKRDALLEMAKGSQAVLVLDHHKSAIEDLHADGCFIIDMGSYQGQLGWPRFMDNVALDSVEGGPRIYTVFDQAKSGAGLCWDFLFPGEPRPDLINRIEDRDLWRFAYPDTRAIQASVFSYPYDFDTWDMLFKADLAVLRTEGEAIERKHFKDIRELLGVVTRRMVIGGHNVPVANLPYTLTSDAGHQLASNGEPFACCYWDTAQGRVFSLRSTDDGLDVSAIAKQYGGGGHRNASGFRVSYDEAGAFEVTGSAKIRADK
jgi:oligoribonuclease NrnB/cAMP/cGMP phosphodiesterase (DHH superfamily)